jgi:hypothetical protein
VTSSQVIFIALFYSGAQLYCAFHCAIMLSQNYFPEQNRHILTFLHPILWILGEFDELMVFRP